MSICFYLEHLNITLIECMTPPEEMLMDAQGLFNADVQNVTCRSLLKTRGFNDSLSSKVWTWDLDSDSGYSMILDWLT